MTTPEHETPPTDVTIELDDENRTEVDADDLAELPFRRRSVEFVCTTGRRETATWGGAPFADLLSFGEVPPATTHLVIETADGYAACVEVEAVLDGLLAWSRDGRRIADENPYATRFVSPAVDGVRFVKGVARVEPVTLSRDEDPADYETVGSESSDADG